MSASAPKTNPKDEMALMRRLWSDEIKDDPYKFVMFVYPWGQKGTPLEHKKGPKRWQAAALKELAEHIKRNKGLIGIGLTPEVFRKATSSGRGPGKSALCAWLIHWMQTCHIGSTVIVTANTEAQLKSRTWAELGKWITLGINAHWFDRGALSMKPAPWFEELLKKQLKLDTGYYYAAAQLWSEENPDAFAGVHNPHGVMVIFDEASGIPAPIWTVTEGFFTDPDLHRYWLAFSNPRRNTGAFFECFHKNRELWRTQSLNSLDVEGADVNHLNSIIRQYGVDSDAARIEVYGQFPHQGDRQFISRSIISAAAARELVDDQWAPLVIGVDVARFGDDASVIYFRRGRDARSIPPLRFKGLDNMALANEVAAQIDKHHPDAVCVDAGNGTGVIDRLREMKYKVHEVWFGAKAKDPQWGNLRTEMYATARDWLAGGCIPAHQGLMDDLAGPEYDFRGSSDVQILEPKERMKDRGLASPDYGDAFVCTFAIRVARLDNPARRGVNSGRVAKDLDFPVFT
jgi:hypothetical protein